MPLSTSVNRSRISALGAAQGDGAGDVGGGVEILAAAVDQVERAARQLAGCSRASRGNAAGRRWGRAPRSCRSWAHEIAGPWPAPARSGQPHPPRRDCRPAAGPSSHARKRATAAPSRRWASAAPASSTGFFCALASTQGSSASTSLAPAAVSRSRNADMRRARVDQHLAASRRAASSAPWKLVDRLDRDGIGQAQAARQLARIDEPAAGPVAGQQGIAQHQWIEGDVAAAQVEQPGDRVGGGQQERVGALLRRPRPRSARAWRRLLSPAWRSSCRRTGAIGRGGRSAQIASTGLGSSGDQLPPLALAMASSRSRSARRASQGS